MEFYRGKRCLVTGSDGFIGTALCTALRNIGATVIECDNYRGCARTHPPSDHVPYDVTNAREVMRLFTIDQPEVVFHLAALTEVGYCHEHPAEAYITNVLGTLNVLEACRIHKVRSVVVASSDKAYGVQQIPYKETMPLLGGGGPYADSKRAADNLAHEYGWNYELPLCVLRCANTYGPGQTNPTTLIGGNIPRLLRREKPTLHIGRESILREWLYIDDAVQAYLLAGEYATQGLSKHDYWGYALNVGSGVIRTAAEIMLFLSGIIYPSNLLVLIESNTWVRPGQLGDQRLDSTRFRNAFPQWKSMDLEEGLRRTVEWHRERLLTTPHTTAV